VKIIDAHLHFGKEAYFDEIARAAHHENNAAHLLAQYEQHGIEAGIVMGNEPLSDTACRYPDKLYYCVGVHGLRLEHSTTQAAADIHRRCELLEKHLRRSECVGIKLYPGYDFYYIHDDALAPLYALAAKYEKPVAVHTGLTAMAQARLKYSHPLVMDEAAAKFPKVQFVMCHFGEPWFTDAAAVIEKNPNVAADLSGMLEGKIPDFPAFLKQKHFYISQLRGWMEYLSRYDRFLFGTDWPLANLGDYIAFTKALLPEEEWEKVFYENAKRIYRL